MQNPSLLTPLDPQFCKQGKLWFGLYQCSCGNEHLANRSLVKCGRIRSCGCMQKESSSKRLDTMNKARSLPPGEASFNSLFSNYKNDAKKRRNLIFHLTKEEFRTLTKQNCNYCGCEPAQEFCSNECNGVYTYNGIDRVDNDVGYILDNCVACCGTCNKWKRKMTKQDFLNHARKITEHNNVTPKR